MTFGRGIAINVC